MRVSLDTPVFRLDPHDNLVVARVPLPAGTAVASEGITVRQDLPAGHKVATVAIAPGEAVRKQGAVIGRAARAIAPGDALDGTAISYEPVATHGAIGGNARPVKLLPEAERATFQGYVRANGGIATRNTIGVFVVGNCGASAARQAADYFTPARLARYPSVDAVVPYVHELGCGMEMTGEPMDLLRRTIAGTIRNPNTAAAVIVALGCERNNLKVFMEQERLEVGPMLRTVVIQDIGGVKKAVAEVIRLVEEMLPAVNQVQREAVSAAHLVLGLKSGGSDGFSGISANPALGAAVDLLVRNGGTAILAETPEILGVEDRLLARAACREVGERLLERLVWWRGYSTGKDTQFNGRVGRGDAAAWLANITEKALGSIQKSGTTPLAAVYRYGEKVRESGLVFMDTPAYDPVSVTGQIAGGATIIAFTTGLGSSFGSLPAPTVKLTSNSAIYVRMVEDMDINCGPVLDGSTTAEEMGRTIFEQLLRHASGQRTKSELGGIGESEFVPWPIGVLA